MKENKDANNSNTNNNTVRNSDIISIERTNNMKNIDLNTITVAEAKALNVDMYDIMTIVVKNPVNSAVTKKNEEFAADLKAKTAKPVRVRNSKKYSQTKKSFIKRLNWQLKVDGVSNLTAFFKGLKDLLGTNVLNWKSMADYNESVLLVMDEVFADVDVTDHTADHVISKGNNWIVNLIGLLKWVDEDRKDLIGDTSNTFWHAYRNPLVSAMEAGLVSDVEGKAALKWIEGLK